MPRRAEDEAGQKAGTGMRRVEKRHRDVAGPEKNMKYRVAAHRRNFY